MSFLKPVLSLLMFAVQAWPKTSMIDAKSCEVPLSPSFMQNLVDESNPRQNLGDAGSFLPGDEKSTKLIDVRGADDHVLAESIIKHLRFDQDSMQNPRLLAALEAGLKVAHARNALVSVSSWVMPDGLRTIRISLDMAGEPGDHVTLVRLPSLDIRNGSLSKRIDIDVTPERLTLLTGNAQALKAFGKVVVGEPASHSLGLEIDGKDQIHPVIDAFSAEAKHFIGPSAQPQLDALLSVAEDVTRRIYGQAKDIAFRTRAEVHALNQGHGWQIPN